MIVLGRKKLNQSLICYIEGTRILGQGVSLHLSMTQNDELPEIQLMIRNVINLKEDIQLHQRTHVSCVAINLASTDWILGWHPS